MGEDIHCWVHSDDTVHLDIPDSFKPEFPVKVDTHGFKSQIADRAQFVTGSFYV